MSKNYQPILLKEITDDVVIEILKVIIPVFTEMGIDYFVVGAFARDIELFAKGYNNLPARKTKDLDLAVLVSNVEEFETLKSEIALIEGFKAHVTEPYRLIFKEKYDLDLLPFGEIEDEKGDVKLKAKKTIVLNMPGFSQAHLAIDLIKTDQNFDLKVSSLPGIVLLKLIAWDDRPFERSKDIQDIEYIIRNLYMLEIEEIVVSDSDLLDICEAEKNYTEAVTARYIGRRIGDLIKDSPKIITRATQILTNNTQNPNNSAMGKMMSFETLEESIKIISQLNLGIEDTLEKEENKTV